MSSTNILSRTARRRVERSAIEDGADTLSAYNHARRITEMSARREGVRIWVSRGIAAIAITAATLLTVHQTEERISVDNKQLGTQEILLNECEQVGQEALSEAGPQAQEAATKLCRE